MHKELKFVAASADVATGILQALGPVLSLFERVEDCVIASATLPTIGRIAVVLNEHAVVIVLQDPKRCQATLQVDVLLRRPRARRFALRVHLDRLPGDDFQGPVQAVLAIVQEHAAPPLGQVQPPIREGGELRPQTPRKKHCIRVNLHSEIVLHVSLLDDHLLPDGQEDRGVVVCVEFALELAVEVDVEFCGHQATQVHGSIGEDRPPVASEDAALGFVLHLHQGGLVPPGKHHYEAIHRQPRRGGGGGLRGGGGPGGGLGRDGRGPRRRRGGGGVDLAHEALGGPEAPLLRVQCVVARRNMQRDLAVAVK